MNTPGKRLTVPQRMLYGMGNMGGNFMNLIFTMWVYKMYCPPEGHGTTLVPIMWLSWAFVAGRIVDSIADPLIGYWSDNTRTRWGRRIPFILFGGLPLCLSFFLLWAPPLALFPPGSPALFIYLCVIMCAFWFLFTAVLCPYLALLPEVATDPDDRLNLATYQSIFLLASSGLVMIGAPIMKDSLGFLKMGLLFTILSVIGIYAPVLAIKEKPLDKIPRSEEDSYGLWTALKWSFSNKPFVIYIIASVLSKIAFNAIMMGMGYIVPLILNKPDSYIGLIMGGTGLVAVVSFLLMNYLKDVVDKSKLYLLSMLMMAIVIPMIWVFGQYDVTLDLTSIGLNFKISELVVAVIVFSLTGFPVAGLMVLPPPILSDIIDQDELNTGRRREAMYFGAQGLVEKAGMAFSGFMMGSLFFWYGSSIDNHLGVDLLGPVTAVFVLAGFFVFLKYPIDSKRSAEIREELQKMHENK